MVLTVLVVLLSQAPSDVTVVPVTSVGVDAATGEQLAFSAQKSLSNRGLRVKQAIDSCKGDRTCLARQGRVLNSRTVVSLSLVKLGDKVVVDVECLRSKTAEVITNATFTVRGSASASELETALKDFVDKVIAAVPPQPPDAPVVKRSPLEPAPADEDDQTPQPPLKEAPVRSARLVDKLPAILVGVGGVALAATSIIFTVKGFQSQNAGVTRSNDFVVAGLSGAVSVVLFATAIVLFLLD